MSAETIQIMTRPLQIGTRGSALALRQTDLVVQALRAKHPTVDTEVRVIKTEGDHNQRDSLRVIGGRGVFVREIELRLIAGEIDVAVHSLKDLPTAEDAAMALALGAVIERGAPFDALVSRHGRVEHLPRGARIGTSSARRAAFMRVLRPDARLSDVRGNIDTRLRKLDEGHYDALLLAAAGLERLNLGNRIAHVFSADDMLPAAGQGAVVAQCRAGDARTLALLRTIEHAPTRAAVDAERAFLRAAGAGCRWPVAAFAEARAQNVLWLRAAIALEDDARIVTGETAGAWADGEDLGAALARKLLAQLNGAAPSEAS